mgnify:CR=1 FL=1
MTTIKQELEFFDVEALPWEAVAGMPGTEQKILAGDRDSADLTRLARMPAGADYEGSLVHDFWEEIWILSGRIFDKRTGLTYTAGMYSCRPPGMEHGPFRFEEDTVVFEVRYTDPHRR